MGIPRLVPFLVVLMCLAGAGPAALSAEAPSTAAAAPGAGAEVARNRVSWEIEWDAYYTSLGAAFSLTEAPIPEAGEIDEIEVYRRLLRNSLLPRFVLLEASVYPMPGLGCVIKHNYPDEYDDLKLGENLNLVKAVTAGFAEPYALSFFTGNIINFKKRGGPHKAGNKGYMGYLVSVGDYHIKDNEAIYDKWYEMEWKLKGDRLFTNQELSWSFRMGAKIHEHPDITDTFYVSLRRSRLDYDAPAASLWKNSGFEYTFNFSTAKLEPVRHYLFLEKKWPLKRMKFAVTLAVGLIWESRERYTGDLARNDAEDMQIIVRPNIHF